MCPYQSAVVPYLSAVVYRIRLFCDRAWKAVRHSLSASASLAGQELTLLRAVYCAICQLLGHTSVDRSIAVCGYSSAYLATVV